MRSLALLSLLLSAPALADESAQMLIWGGGDTKEQAETVLGGYRKAEKAVRAVAPPSAGYPKVVESKDYPGLKPGFWVVALGICQSLDKALLDALKAVQPQVYARPLTGKVVEACPGLLSQSVVAEKAEARKKPFVLYAFSVSSEKEGENTETGTGRSDEFNPAGTTYVLLRNDKTGEVLDLAELEGDSHTPSGNGPEGTEYRTCTGAMAAQGSALVFTRDCVDQNVSCTQSDQVETKWDDITRLTISGQSIQQKSSHKVTGTVRCEPTPEGEGD